MYLGPRYCRPFVIIVVGLTMPQTLHPVKRMGGVVVVVAAASLLWHTKDQEAVPFLELELFPIRWTYRRPLSVHYIPSQERRGFAHSHRWLPRAVPVSLSAFSRIAAQISIVRAMPRLRLPLRQ